MRGFGKMSHKSAYPWNPITALFKLYLTPTRTSHVVHEAAPDDHDYGVATFPLRVSVSARMRLVYRDSRVNRLVATVIFIGKVFGVT